MRLYLNSLKSPPVVFILKDNNTNGEEKPNNQMTTYEQVLAVGRKKSLLIGRNFQQNEAQGGAAISHDQLEMRGGRRDKGYALEESQR